jgi:uncharacterized protein YkwD
MANRRERRDAKPTGLTTREGAGGRATEGAKMGRIAAARKSIGASAALVVAISFLGVVAAPARATDDLRSQVYRATNVSRVALDRRRLDINANMSDLARRHSLAMARAGELYHTRDPANYYLRSMRWSKWGENVGATTGSIADLEAAFMDSPEHRANILDRAFNKVAIGAVRRDGTVWVTVFFYG